VKRRTLVWLTLHWPREVSDDQVSAVWRRLPALAGWPLIVEAVGRAGQVEHRMAVRDSRHQAVIRQLGLELPGLSLQVDDPRSVSQLDQAGELHLTTRRRPLATGDLALSSRALLAALSLAGKNEALVLQWVLGHPLHPQATPSGNAPLTPESWLGHLANAALGINRPADSEPRRALAAKQGEAGWKACGRMAVQASGRRRQAQLLGQLAGALRLLETPGLRLVASRRRSTGAEQARVPWYWPLRLNALELAAVSAWPVGRTIELPVSAVASRMLPAPRAVPRSGRIVAESAFGQTRRPLALSAQSSLRHTLVIGPTGVGKSTLLLNLITQDLNNGHGVVVIEPKGDLIADVLARVPKERLDDVALLDPLDRDCPVGVNPLAAKGRSPELVADQLLGIFHALYSQHWGPRTQDILGASLLTLAQIPGMTLVAVPVLLTNPNFRRRVLSQINDPVGLSAFWAGFEAWSEAERTVACAPVLNKLRPFLLRPSLRALLGQARPRFDLSEIFTARKVLLVNLAKGQLGPEASVLLGSLIVGQLWQVAQGRSSVPARHRRPVFIYLDEFQDFLRLPVDLADALAQARGLGVALTLAHQHLAQLSSDVRPAVLANAQSKVCFRLSADDARVLATGSQLAPEDFSGLGAYECYLQLVADNAVQPWTSGRTLPPSASTSQPAVVRSASRANYGQSRTEVEAAIVTLVNGSRDKSSDDLTPRRRGGRT
jgi:hypothetical protein